MTSNDTTAILNEIAPLYGLDAKGCSCEAVGSGHINKTYRLETADGKRLLLQRINTVVFTKPVELMENIVAVTDFLRTKIPADEVLKVNFAVDGKSYAELSDGSFWRVYDYVDNAFSYDEIESPELFYQAGAAFGRFQKLLSDFPADKLYETIESFHDTTKRLEQLKAAVERNESGRLDSCRKEVDFALKRADITGIIVDGIRSGKIPVRVTHNDTKLNNIMFDSTTKKPKCIVDLDTVMPGSALYDFGDAIRFGASTAAEDEKNLDKVDFSVELYKAFAGGFLSEAKDSLTEAEIDLMPMSAIIITLECGMRFLADYINGDKYFAVDYPEHNLVRCRTQFKLVECMENRLDELKKITNEI